MNGIDSDERGAVMNGICKDRRGGSSAIIDIRLCATQEPRVLA